MRWARVEADGRPQLAVLSDDRAWCLGAVSDRRAVPAAIREAVVGDDLTSWIAADAEEGGVLGSWLTENLDELPTRPLASVRLLSPIRRPPKNVVCVGRNYVAHAEEAARFRGQAERPPAHPMFFTKPRTAIIGPGDEICCDPSVSTQLDYEGELAVVIGRGGRDIELADAYSHVFGYTLLDDVTARDLQARHGQYYKGKGLDTFAPLGPVVVTGDEIPCPEELALETRVNGELRQRASLGQLIFDIPRLISELSLGMTLEPGDVLSTGTPAGVGISFDPPRFLIDGDVVEVSSPSIGILRNRVRVGPRCRAQGVS